MDAAASPYSKTSGDGKKITKEQAGYRDPSDLAGKRCGGCDMFRSPAGCTLVQGQIARGAVCDYFEARR